MQGKDAHNPDVGYPVLPTNDTVPLAPPPYSAYPHPAPGNAGYSAQGYPSNPPASNPGYQQQGYPGNPPAINPAFPHGDNGHQGSVNNAQPTGPANTGYPHPPSDQAQVHAGPMIVIAQLVGREPTRVTCQSCNKEMVTRTEDRATVRTHLMALLLCVFGCWFCACLPYCMRSCLDVNHYCSKCGAFIGTYSS